MKNRKIQMAIVALTLAALLGWMLKEETKTFSGVEELSEKARSEMKLEEGETLRCVGQSESEDLILFWFMGDLDSGEHAYIALECVERGPEEYQVYRTCKPARPNPNLAVEQWEKGYSVLVNDPDCAAVRFTDDGALVHEEKIPEDRPYLFFCEGFPLDYEFLDAEGGDLLSE